MAALSESPVPVDQIDNDRHDHIHQNYDEGDEEISVTNTKVSWWKFESNLMAQGYAINGIGRGALAMSNIFLSTAFIHLSSDQAGCVDDENNVIDNCDGKVYGVKPGSLIAHIAVISGVLSAIFMPIAGAMIDCTDYRRCIGILTVTLITVIQAIQIYLTKDTWFIMAILQALIGFIFQIQVLCIFAYLPEMARDVGESTMTNFTATFIMLQFTAQALYVTIIIGLSFALGISDDDVTTARYSQGICVVWISICFYFGWRRLPSVPARRVLPEGRTLLSQGFQQVWYTIKSINRDYKNGLRWYFLGLIFAESAINSFAVVSIIYLTDHIGLSVSEIGIFFLITLFASIPGSRLGAYITHQTDPSRSYRYSILCLIIVTVTGSLLVDYTNKSIAYVWAICTGMLVGWFYPVKGLYFSMALPKNQEAEYSGLFVYCTQILGWAPPLLFASLVEAGISQTIGVMSIAIFFAIGFCFLSFSASWLEILEESKRACQGDNVVLSSKPESITSEDQAPITDP